MAPLMQTPERGRPLAVMLLIVVLIVAYLVLVHPFLMRHFALMERQDDLAQSEARFLATARQREAIETRLDRIREYERTNDYFLKEGNFNLAAAELTRRLKSLVTAQAEDADNCQVISTQNVRPREEERYEAVTVKVRMRCEMGDVSRVMAELERGAPLIFIDQVSIYRQTIRGRESNPQLSALDVRFDMTGYLRGAS